MIYLASITRSAEDNLFELFILVVAHFTVFRLSFCHLLCGSLVSIFHNNERKRKSFELFIFDFDFEFLSFFFVVSQTLD